jgi:hypothetical protein
MKYIRPTHVALAILAGALATDPANACTPSMPCSGSMGAAPTPPPASVRPPTSPSVNPVIPPSVNPNITVRGSGEGKSDFNEYNEIKSKIRAKNPNADDARVNSAAQGILNKRKKERKEREYWEWKKQDNADTNRRRQEQQAKENYNPNADVYDQSVPGREKGGYGGGGGYTKQEIKDYYGHRVMPGQKTGAENP